MTASEPSTAHMREFAARTHQPGTPGVASEFQPARIDLAAMPIRVEQWAVNGRTRYRVVGVTWGGTGSSGGLLIRFRASQPFVPVSQLATRQSPTTWSLWSHEWQPEVPGRYQIVLKAGDAGVRTTRLDLFYYTREVHVIDT